MSDEARKGEIGRRTQQRIKLREKTANFQIRRLCTTVRYVCIHTRRTLIVVFEQALSGASHEMNLRVRRFLFVRNKMMVK